MTRRRLLTGLFALAASLAVIGVEMSGRPAPLLRSYQVWLGANAIAHLPARVAFIQIKPPAGAISALDAALVLRAVERFKPAGAVFLNPVAHDSSLQLLEARLMDCRFPVIFTASRDLKSMAQVRASDRLAVASAGASAAPGGAPAGAGIGTFEDGFAPLAVRAGGKVVASNVFAAFLAGSRISAQAVTGSIPGALHAGASRFPVRADGSARINPSAPPLVESIALDDLMVRTERSERGIISPDLEEFFRGRVVACGIGESGARGAIALAAVMNELLELPAPAWSGFVLALVAASLPWWRMPRFERVAWAVIAAAVWALLAIAFYQEYRVIVPLSVSLLLPLIAGLLALGDRAIKRN